MNRQITTHVVPGQSNELNIEVHDMPGAGNACHDYVVRDHDGQQQGHIRFQKGLVAENGINGISNEVLLAIVKDRLEGFQSGAYACRENALALVSVDNALVALKSRTEARIARCVEGTSQK